MFIQISDGRKIFCEEHGTPGGSPIVFLNGLTQSTLAWHLILPYFKSYRVVLLDFVFQGQSDKEGKYRRFDEHASDVFAVMKHLKIAKAHIAGISYGSIVAQHFAVNQPESVNKLVLISTFAHKTPYYEAIELSWWRALEQGGYQLMLDVMLPSVLSEEYFSNPLIPLQSLKDMRKEMNVNSDAILKLMQATKERSDYRSELARITAPTLIIQGEKDLLLPVHLAQDVQRNIRGSKLVVLKHAGHTLNLERVPELAKRMLEFLA